MIEIKLSRCAMKLDVVKHKPAVGFQDIQALPNVSFSETAEILVSRTAPSF
jgi:hypothetical protein